jgi:hypothetical protein
MKVYLGIECYNDLCDITETVVKVFADETDAYVWQKEFENQFYKSGSGERIATEWRTYREMEVE